MGKLYHELLSSLQSLDQWPGLAQSYVLTGKMSEEESQIFQSRFLAYVNTHGINSWYTRGVEVKLEAGILLPGGRSLRPDRVVVLSSRTLVIDYKFGHQKMAAYAKQIKQYAHCLIEMGYNGVEAYLCYIYLNEMEKISIE